MLHALEAHTPSSLGARPTKGSAGDVTLLMTSLVAARRFSQPATDGSAWQLRRGGRMKPPLIYALSTRERQPGRSPIPEVRHRRRTPHADREPHLHARIVVAQRTHPARVLEQQAVRVLEVDRLHPLVVDDGGHPHALRNQLGALRRERLERAELEGEVVEHVGQAEAAVDAGVVLARDAGHAARLHEGEQLPVAGIEEDVADLAALLHLHRIAAHPLEAEDALAEGARAVHVEGGEADVREALACHGEASVQSIAMPPPMLTDTPHI